MKTTPVIHEGQEYRQVIFPHPIIDNMNTIAQQAALAFLTKLHNGSCSVPADSPFGHTFAGLQVQGEVELRLSSTAGYVDVYVKGYKNGKKS